jgi:hypothetical protein
MQDTAIRRGDILPLASNVDGLSLLVLLRRTSLLSSNVA